MTCVKVLLIGLITAASTAAADDPPAFGTVVQEWHLLIQFANGGITWRRDSERFYLMDQGYSGSSGVWSCDPLDPVHSLRRENWVMPDVGSDTADIPWGLAWDSDSNCFWISTIVDGDIYSGSYYFRMRRTAVGDTWRWFPENPGDTWLVSSAGNMYWMAGSEKCDGRDYFACAPVGSGYPYNNVWKFDPYTKTSVGRCSSGHIYSERGCALVPWDSNYIITTGWGANKHYLRDSNGVVLRSADAATYAPFDISLWFPQTVRAEDTVFFYCICGNQTSTIQKISVGLLWGQLEPGQAVAEPKPSPAQPAAFRIEPNPCRGVLFLQNGDCPAKRGTVPSQGPVRFPGTVPGFASVGLSQFCALLDAAGRKVLDLHPGPNDVRSLAPGVYFVRPEPSAVSRKPSAVTKVIVTR